MPRSVADSQVQVACLSECVSVIQEAEDREALNASVLNGIRAFGFSHFCLSNNIKDKHELLTPMLTSMDASFFNDYDKYGFIEICPVFASLVRVAQPFCWTSHWTHGDRAETKLVEYLRSLPEKRGLALPMLGRDGSVSVANFSSDGDARFDEMTTHSLSIIAKVAMIKAECLGLSSDDNSARLGDADLSARQIEILHWAAQGKSNGDIAAIVGRSKRAVDWHISEILRKLKVASRSQAVALFGGGRRR